MYSNRRPPGGALAPLCRVVPRAANRNKHDCRWQSYRYYAVMGNAVTEGVYAIDMVKAIVRYSPTKFNRTPPPSALKGSHLPLHAGRLTLCRFCIWTSSASGHATAPTRKNDRDYRPSSVCPSGSHLPPWEGIPQMDRYTFTLSNRTPSTLTSGFCEKFRERGKIEVEFMGVLCYDNAVSIWACCALK